MEGFGGSGRTLPSTKGQWTAQALVTVKLDAGKATTVTAYAVCSQ